MLRRLLIAVVCLGALAGCTTYHGGYHQAPAHGYGGYYYAPATTRVYHHYPDYLAYPSYYSLFWEFDRRYYSPWHRPYFHYGVTWFPSDWFAFDVVHRHPRHHLWHPYAPYRYSAWDHHFVWHHHHFHHQPRQRHRSTPRYGHVENSRQMQREQPPLTQRNHRHRTDARAPGDDRQWRRERSYDDVPRSLSRRDLGDREYIQEPADPSHRQIRRPPADADGTSAGHLERRAQRRSMHTPRPSGSVTTQASGAVDGVNWRSARPTAVQPQQPRQHHLPRAMPQAPQAQRQSGAAPAMQRRASSAPPMQQSAPVRQVTQQPAPVRQAAPRQQPQAEPTQRRNHRREGTRDDFIEP